MFNKDQLQGIMLASSIPEVIVARDNGVRLGYRVRLRISLRGHSVFLSAIQRSLLQYEIDATYSYEYYKERGKGLLLQKRKERVKENSKPFKQARSNNTLFEGALKNKILIKRI